MARKRRKARKGEVVCRCGAYRFPHRQFGGACISDVLSTTWEREIWGKCRDCRLFEQRDEGPICAALDGREHWIRGDCMAEHIQQHEIRLYGVNKPPSEKPRRR